MYKRMLLRTLCPWRSGCNCHGYQLVLLSSQSTSAGLCLSSSESNSVICRYLCLLCIPITIHFSPFLGLHKKSTHISHLVYFNKMRAHIEESLHRQPYQLHFSPFLSFCPSLSGLSLYALHLQRSPNSFFLYRAPSHAQGLVLSLSCNIAMVVTLMKTQTFIKTTWGI